MAYSIIKIGVHGNKTPIRNGLSYSEAAYTLNSIYREYKQDAPRGTVRKVRNELHAQDGGDLITYIIKKD